MSFFKAYEFPLYVSTTVAYYTKQCYVKFKYLKRRSATHLACKLIVRGEEVVDFGFVNVSDVSLYGEKQIGTFGEFEKPPFPVEVGADEIIPIVSGEMDVAVDPYHAYILMVEGPPSGQLDVYWGQTKLMTINPKDLDQDGKGLTVVVFVPTIAMTLTLKPSNCNWSLFRITYLDYMGGRVSPILVCKEMLFTGNAYEEIETLQASMSALSLNVKPSSAGAVFIESWEVGWSGSGASSPAVVAG